MTYNPKLTIGAAILFFLLSIVGAYFAVERSKSLVTEQLAHEETKTELDLAKATITTKEAQLKRALSTRIKETPVLLGNTIAYEKTTESLENTESRTSEYTAQIEQLTQSNARLQDTVDRLTKLETSKSGLKRWGTLVKYNFPHWEAGLGIHQDLGLLDVSVYGFTSVPLMDSYSVALGIRF